jgi:pantetheine-phosphate adenylyltransferase
MTRAFYAGSFDPPTLGHIYVITKALDLFDEVFVGIGTNPAKANSYMFSVKERLEMIEEVFRKRNVVVGGYGGYLVHAAMDRKCSHIVRGIRNARDLEDEMAMAELNKTIALTHRDIKKRNPQTIFIPTPSNLALVSSSMVKSLIGFGDWKDQIKQFVPEPTYNALVEKYAAGR